MSIPEINEKNVNLWSKLGPRAVYGQALLSLFSDNTEIIALSADMGNSSGLERLGKTYPDRYLDTGIAEQNMIGVAAGLAKEGFTVFASSFAPFITMRACEQIRMNLGYMQMNVKAVGIGSGLSMGFLGNSHFGLEDVAIVSSIPGIQIVSPADCVEIFQAVYAIARSNRPTYLRLTGSPGLQPIYRSNYDFELGKAITMKQGGDFGIVSSGSMVAQSLEASNTLENDGVSCSVTNFHTIRPIDVEMLLQISRNSKAIFVVEEHFDSGGLCTSVMEVLMKSGVSTPIYPIGIQHKFDITGDYDFLLEYHGLSVDGIVRRIKARIGEFD